MNTGLSSAPDCSSYPSKYGGSGTESSPWTVMNVSGLQCMNQTLDGNYTLGQNIDASYTENWNSGSGFDPVAEDFDVYFEGLLDGNGYAINELHIDRPSEEYVGLFGFTRGSNITNLQLSNVNITGGNYTGALSGTNAAFEVSKAWISRLAVTGEVNGGNQVGGIVGYQIYSPTTISESFVNANVSGGSSVGGLIGSNAQNALVNNSYSISYVKATGGGGNYDAASGLVGLQENGITRNSFSSSDVESVTWVGQVLFDPDKEPEDTYWNGDKIYDSDADAYSNRGTNLTEAEMKGNSAQTAMSGLDFTDTWETVEASDSDASGDGYPILQALDRGSQLEVQGVDLQDLLGSIVGASSEGVIQTENGVVQTTP